MKGPKKAVAIFVFITLALLVYTIIPENRSELRTSHFIFRYSSSIDSSKIVDLSKALEENCIRIDSEFQILPAKDIETNIYAHRWRYAKVTRDWDGAATSEGILKLHFVDREWSEDENKKVAVHEFTHTAVLKLLIDQEMRPLNTQAFAQRFSGFPIWLWEGIGVYEANQFVDPKTLPYLSNGQYPNISELNSRVRDGRIYTCGYTIIEYILARYGQTGLNNLIRTYGDVNGILHVTEDQFIKEWYEFVKEKYLK